MPHLSAAVLLIDPTGAWIVTGAGAWKRDPKTMKVIKFVPEKMPPGGWAQFVEATSAGADLLHTTEGVKGAEELRTQLATFLVSATEAVTTQATTKM